MKNKLYALSVGLKPVIDKHKSNKRERSELCTPETCTHNLAKPLKLHSAGKLTLTPRNRRSKRTCAQNVQGNLSNTRRCPYSILQRK